MSKYYGWAGTILNVDLTTGQIEREALSPVLARKYLGASGLNSAKLFELVKPEVDALSPENVLFFGVGTLTGTLVPGSARLTVTAKSPKNNTFGDSNMGGFFSTELKFAGYDQLIFFGKAQRPVYLWIDDDEVELRDASFLWGKSTWDTARMIKEEIGDPFIQVVCIGPGGENLSKVATIMCPTKRAAGRSGMGTVMGAKNLKAVAVRGSKDVAIARPDEFLKACMEMSQTVIESHPRYNDLHEYGTPLYLDAHMPLGIVGVRNYQAATFDNWEALSCKALKRDFYRAMRACTACQVACGPFYSIKSGEFAGNYGEGPEYADTEMSVLWGCDNLAAVLKYQELCNQYGIDVYSVGSLIAWAMECYEKGILTKEDYDGGTPLSFGDYESVIEIIPKIARREGFGAILTEGEKMAPELLGRGSDKYMYQVKGQAFIAIDCRASPGHGIQALTSSRGGDHLKTNIGNMRYLLRDHPAGKDWQLRDSGQVRSPSGIGMVAKWCQDATQIVDALGICTRTGGSIKLLTRTLSAATGIDFTEKELLEVGERICNVQKAFNARQGLTRKDDNFSVPEFNQRPIKDGPRQGKVLERDLLLDEYYRERGWDLETGLPTRKKLVELGLEHVADELEKVDAIK